MIASVPDDQIIVLAADPATRRVGCVLLQAVYGCGEHNTFLQETFDTEDWVLAPTPGMAPFRGTAKQWREHAQSLRAKRGARK